MNPEIRKRFPRPRYLDDDVLERAARNGEQRLIDRLKKSLESASHLLSNDLTIEEMREEILKYSGGK